VAIPLRDDGSPGPEKHLVVFVHGFASTSACWNELCALLRRDTRFSEYELRSYEYPTTLVGGGLLSRIPSLKELGRGLGSFLSPFFGDARGDAYISITLVGHSMGGLVIQSWLVDQLHLNRGYDVKQIRQIILLATPNLGSRTVSSLRKLVYSIASNPQERMLRILEPEISDICGVIQQKVISAVDRDKSECPIPIHAFWGQNDGVVEEASARGAFPNSSPLRGDHFEIIRPESAESEAYRQISDAILEPQGHQHIFEIEEFRFFVKVEPRDDHFEQEAVHGSTRRTVRTNNVAQVRREARFSHKNRCREIFTIKYATQNAGFVKYEVSHPNLATSDLTSLWDYHGSSAWFQFRPEPRQTYSLNLEVFKGFDGGFCDVHHHLNRQAYFQKYIFELDLSSYVESGRAIRTTPTLCFLRHDPGHTALCSERNKLNPNPPLISASGVWRWELDHVREGLVDVRWATENAKDAAGAAKA